MYNIHVLYVHHLFLRKGDYCRYKAEYTSGNDRDEASEQSCSAYEKAEKEAQSLPSTHPIRLGLSLNFSVFYYEIKGDSEKACEIAKKVNKGIMIRR